jgi:hypothetical protein
MTSHRKFLAANAPLFMTAAVLLALVGGAWLQRAVRQRGDRLDIEVVRAPNPAPARPRPSPAARPVSASQADDPNLRFAARTESAGALLAALGGVAQSLQLAGRRPAPAAIVSELVARNLVPPGLILHRDGDRILFLGLCECAVLEFRFRPAPFLLEVLSFPRELPRDGDAFILRLPETFNDRSGVAMYVAKRSQSTLPPAFAPPEAWKRSGWMRLPFSPEILPAPDRQRLWIAMSDPQGGR